MLLKLHRPAEAAERGLAFVRLLGERLAARQRAGSAPPHLKEAWCFAAALSVAGACSRAHAAARSEARRSDHGRSAAK